MSELLHDHIEWSHARLVVSQISSSASKRDRSHLAVLTNFSHHACISRRWDIIFGFRNVFHERDESACSSPQWLVYLPRQLPLHRFRALCVGGSATSSFSRSLASIFKIVRIRRRGRLDGLLGSFLSWYSFCFSLSLNSFSLKHPRRKRNDPRTGSKIFRWFLVPDFRPVLFYVHSAQSSAMCRYILRYTRFVKHARVYDTRFAQDWKNLCHCTCWEHMKNPIKLHFILHYVFFY